MSVRGKSFIVSSGSVHCRVLEEGDVQRELASVRVNVKKCFETTKCFLMSHPGQKVDTSPEFRGSLSGTLKSHISSHSKILGVFSESFHYKLCFGLDFRSDCLTSLLVFVLNYRYESSFLGEYERLHRGYLPAEPRQDEENQWQQAYSS